VTHVIGQLRRPCHDLDALGARASCDIHAGNLIDGEDRRTRDTSGTDSVTPSLVEPKKGAMEKGG
jgi:hypothetical protein